MRLLVRRIFFVLILGLKNMGDKIVDIVKTGIMVKKKGF